MANDCDAELIINLADEEAAKLFAERLGEWSHGDDDGWLGNLLINAGLAESRVDVEAGDVMCRGYITDVSYRDGRVFVETESDYEPMFGAIRLALEAYFADTDGVTMEFTAINYDEEMYVTNIDALVGNYLVDIAEPTCSDAIDKAFADRYEHDRRSTYTLNELVHHLMAALGLSDGDPDMETFDSLLSAARNAGIWANEWKYEEVGTYL